MKLTDAVKICKSIGNSEYLDSEKYDAIKKAVESPSRCRMFSVSELWSMLEFLFKVVLNDEAAKWWN